MICCHRECNREAGHHLEVNHYTTDVCGVHYALLEKALREAGGYSAANTQDNVYGWK